MSRVSVVALYIIFFLTGVCVALPGALLPRLLPLWQMSDARGGLLLFVFFAGSSLGGLLARGRLLVAIRSSCALIALTCATVPHANEAVAYVVIAIMGFCLGRAMTSISLLRSRTNPQGRSAEFARLNLLWACGACAGPSLAIKGSEAIGLNATLLLLSGAFAIAPLALATTPSTQSESLSPAGAPAFRTTRTVVFMMLTIPLATGIESASGGWLSVYADRTVQHRGSIIGTVTVFWAALLFSRLAHSTRRIATLPATYTLRLYPMFVFLGLALLWRVTTPFPEIIGAALVGWGIGPIFPIALAVLLSESEVGNLGFLFAGIGGACLPMLTGIVSNHTQSIRLGLATLLVPAFALIVLGLTTTITIYPPLSKDGPETSTLEPHVNGY
jgi:fucose permease